MHQKFEKIKVSIIVPVYNVAKYIRKCIESLLDQDYTGEIEIICIDDGSTDGTSDILIKISASDKRIRYYYQENQGVSVARNEGLRRATGDYVMFCDSDDYYDRNAVSTCAKKAMDESCSAVLFNFRKINAAGVIFEKGINIWIPEQINCDTSEYLGNFASVCLCFFKREIIVENGLVFLEGRLYEDWEFMSHFLSFCDTVYWVNESLYNYRWDQAVSNSTNITERCLDIFNTFESTKLYFGAVGRWENIQYLFYIRAIEHLDYFLDLRLKPTDDDIKEEYLNRTIQFVNGIPYELYLSVCRCFPLDTRIRFLAYHNSFGVELEHCKIISAQNFISKIPKFIRKFIKKICFCIFPTYRV